MPAAGRRSPRLRLLLTLAALASLIAGYYLGQYWQRRPLAGLSAVVFAAGQPVEFPPGTEPLPARPAADGAWRLFVAADTRDTRCRDLLRHHAAVINRLAAWPEIQDKVRLTLLAYDRPDAAAISTFSRGLGWVQVISAEPAVLDALGAQLDIGPAADAWCTPATAAAALVSPQHEHWALIPHEQAAIMAHNIRTIIAFVE